MLLPRRRLLLGTLVVLVGCTSDPTVDAPSDVPPRAQPSTAPAQDPLQSRAAAALAGVRVAVEALPASTWCTAALVQLDDQLAHLNSAQALLDPDPIFTPTPTPVNDLAAGLRSAVETLRGCAQGAPDEAHRLLYISCAAATLALQDQRVLPGEGGSPSPLDGVRGERELVLSHMWALIYGMELGLGRLPAKDPLRELLRQRLAAARTLREAIVGDEPAPPQPASFQMPNPMSTPAEIHTAWGHLEANLLEALVLRAANRPEDAHWVAQVAAVHAAGGRVPRWPGWE